MAFFTQTLYLPPSIGTDCAPPVLTARGPAAFCFAVPEASAAKGATRAPAAAAWAARNDRREILIEAVTILKLFRSESVFFLRRGPLEGGKGE